MERIRLTAFIETDGDGYVALCPELDIGSEGDTVEHARTNLAEALELFFEAAPADEIALRLRRDVFVTSVEVSVGLRSASSPGASCALYSQRTGSSRCASGAVTS